MIQLHSLTSIRAFAAWALVLYHFRDRYLLTPPPEFLQNIIMFLPLGVDLFFVLSGFILSYVYANAATGQSWAGFNYIKFIGYRLGRLYPLHLATLLAYMAIVFGGALVGIAPNNPASYPNWHLPFHFTLTHAWGFTERTSWNDPSWSISAEWFAYLFLMPLAVWLLGRCRAWLGLLAALVLLLFSEVWLQSLIGESITRQGSTYALFRIIPEFLLGHFLFQTIQHTNWRWRLPPSWVVLALVAAMVLLVGLGLLPRIGVVPLLAFIIALFYWHDKAAAAGRLATPWLHAKPLVYLGEVSYATYMVHMLVYTLFFNIIEKLWPVQAVGWWVIPSFGVVLLASVVAYHLVELPGRAAVRRWTDRLSQRKTR